MAEDKGSDLDVFEGLAKKKTSSPPASAQVGPPPPGTLRGGLAPPASSAGGKASVPPPSAGALPKAAPPPPSKKSSPAPALSDGGDIEPADDDLQDEPTGDPAVEGGESEPPEMSVDSSDFVSIDDDEDSAPVLPGQASAELDWDDEEEATQVFSRQGYGLFNDLAGKQFVSEDADQTAKRNVAKVAVLLHGSGGEAAPVQSAPPPAVTAAAVASVAPESEVPASAVAASEISDAYPVQEGRQPQPSWAPSMAPPARQSRSTLVLALCAITAVCAAVYFVINRAPSTATLIVRVEHQGKLVDRAKIYLDGLPTKCEFTPCKLADLPPGTKSIRVAAGLLAGKAEAVLAGGAEKTVTVTLGRTDSPAPPDEATALASIKLSSKQSGIKVFVDGQAKGTLPLELKDLKPGKLSLRFEGGDKLGKLEKEVELKSGQALSIDDIELPLQKVAVSFEVNPAGAKVSLLQDEKNPAALAFTKGKAKKDLDTSKSWSVKATATGYRPYNQKLRFEPGKEAQTVAIVLEKDKAADKPQAANTAAAPGPKETATAKPPPPAKSKHGTLNANSIPPSKVIIDGRPRGSTPVTGVRVPPGGHTVVFIHKKYGRKSRRLTVAAGQTKTAVVRFKKK